MEKIKLMFVVTSCKKSGPIQQMFYILKYLDRNKFDVFLVTLYREIENVSQLAKYLELNIEHKMIELSKKQILLNKTKKLKEYIDYISPDIIHTLGVFPGYAISKLKYKNHFETLRNYVYEDYLAKFGKIKGLILSKVHLKSIKKNSLTITCSESLAKKYKDKLGLSFDFIRNGVDIHDYSLATKSEMKELRIKLGLPSEKIIFVYSGQFVSRKNQEFLLELFSKNKFENSVLLLLGDGVNYESLKSKYSSNSSFIMTGNVKNVNDYLKASNIYISSSKSEGLPNGVLEAMATGLPVILSNIEQHLELYNVNNNIGLIFKLDDYEDCEKCIKKMLSSDLSFFSQNAQRTANSDFSAEIMSEKYQEKYMELVEKNKKNK